MNRDAVNALVREIDPTLDTRKALTDRQLADISAWRHHAGDTTEHLIAREEVGRGSEHSRNHCWRYSAPMRLDPSKSTSNISQECPCKPLEER